MVQPQQRPPAVNPGARVPLNSFPGELRAALAQSWDKAGTGTVTIGELTAGAAGGNSSRNARNAREVARYGSAPPAAAPQPPGARRSNFDNRHEMPGDMGVLDNVGLAEGADIWDRMAAIIRRQKLDVRILLDAHDRRNAGVVDIDTFSRALCYAFGNHWTELGLTSAEFQKIVKPYLTRTPNNPGEPSGFVFWQKFATDLQTYADRRVHSDNFMSRLSKVEAKERVAANIQSEYGVSEYELKKAFASLKNVLMLRAGSQSHLVTVAFRNMDRDHTGKIAAKEIAKYLNTAQRGNEQVNPKVMECIVDLCDADGDGEVRVCA